MNVYDFDKTIYPKDSTGEFFRVSLFRHPSFLLDLPRTLCAYLRHKRGKLSAEGLREAVFSSFRRIRDLEGEVERFWQKRKHKLFAYYREIRRDDDVVISASPEFILRPIAREAGFGTLIASRFDPHADRYEGARCYGEEKPKRFYELFPEAKVEAFYSDSLSDTPMARLAERAYIVKRSGKLVPWPEETLSE